MRRRFVSPDTDLHRARARPAVTAGILNQIFKELALSSSGFEVKTRALSGRSTMPAPMMHEEPQRGKLLISILDIDGHVSVADRCQGSERECGAAEADAFYSLSIKFR